MYVTKIEIAKMFSIPVSTVDYLRRKGKIPYILVGRHRRYYPERVRKHLEKRNNN